MHVSYVRHLRFKHLFSDLTDAVKKGKYVYVEYICFSFINKF